jgi:hypothetical protein
VRHRVEDIIPAGQCPVRRAAAITEDIEVRHRVEDIIPADRCPARRAVVIPEAADTVALLRAADRAEATPEAVHVGATLEADPMVALPAVAILLRATTADKMFPPRFTPLLTHRQEAPKGASCPL